MIKVGDRVRIKVCEKYAEMSNGKVCRIINETKRTTRAFQVDIISTYNYYFPYELIKVVKDTKLARKMYGSMIHSIEDGWINLKGEHEQNA